MSQKPFKPAGYTRMLALAFSALMLGLACAVAWYQLRPTEELTRKSIKEQTRLVYVPACRGTLAARDGTPLNYTLPSYAIVIRPDLVRDPRDTRMATLGKLESEISSLASALGPEYYLKRPTRERILKHLIQEPAMPLHLWEDVDELTRSRWLAIQRNYPSTELMLSWKRIYDMPDVAPQLRGMTRKQLPPPNPLERYWNANSLELSGASGMEKALDYLLSGEGGTELLQTDVLSYRSRVMQSRPASKGAECRLTIDLKAQQLAESRFRQNNLTGAAVAIDMQTGQVLVMASSPATPLGASATNAADGGMLNRALAAYYPSGSVIKPLYAIYALDHEIATPETPVVDCHGFFQLTSKRKLGCSHVHGQLAIEAAIAQSCNTFFCTLAQSFTNEQLDDFATFFGFGEKTGGDLAEQEIAGVPFSPKWVKENRKNDNVWHPGDAANGGIGQGGWIITPMQMALAMNFALTGNLLTPKFYLNDEPTIRNTYDFSETARKVVIDGMRKCVLEGTGTSMDTPLLPIIAKTGTAENGSGKRPHAWVVAAAPADNPRHLVVVAVEHGGGGGRVAGPIARDILLSLNASIPLHP